MKNPSMEEIRAMLDRGELDVPSGTTVEDLARTAEGTFAMLLSILMGMPPERITIEIIQEIGITGKIGMAVYFDPELSPEESARYERALGIAAGLLGARPPTKMASA